MKLSELEDGSSAIISKVRGSNAIKKRITEMGFVKGRRITVIKTAPLKDPVEYDIMGYRISLRNSEAEHIEVIETEETNNIFEQQGSPSVMESLMRKAARKQSKVIEVALVGNPNAGKTTLFNFASHSKERVGNYSGVTIEAKEARFKHAGYIFNIVDLPGTYSLTAYSPEELYVRQYITQEMPDIVINVVDAANIERNLYLTTQLIDMDIRVIMALNMYDELKKCGDTLDYDELAKITGLPIVPTISSRGKGVLNLFDKVIETYTQSNELERQVHINYGLGIEKSIRKIQNHVWNNRELSLQMSSRFMAIKLLEKDSEIETYLQEKHELKYILKEGRAQIELLENRFQEEADTLITDARYTFIAGALRKTLKRNTKERYQQTHNIDKFLTHRIWGYPIFAFSLWMMFQLTFSVGQYPMEWIESGINLLRFFINLNMTDGMLKDLILDGIIGGVGGVVVFLPNIAILFFIISLMEDTGYMARAAFIMDNLMSRIGLHGKSFIPLIMGFGCNVPAIMSTRMLDSSRNRLVTILINPLMSCSARLPVYLLVIGAFFPNHASFVLASIYMLGIVLAIGVAWLSKFFLKQDQSVPFVMELPPYRIPTASALFGNVSFKAGQYLKKMGGVILIASILIWALGYFPKKVSYSVDYDAQIEQINLQYEQNEISNLQKNEKVRTVKKAQNSERVEMSYIGRIGKALAPIMKPLGFDWKMTVALISGAAAKEVVISTMGVLYQTGNEEALLKDRLRQAEYSAGENTGEKVFDSVSAIGFLIFVLIYFPCIASVAAIRKETGSWKWAGFAVGYTTGLAWLLAFGIQQVGSVLM